MVGFLMSFLALGLGFPLAQQKSSAQKTEEFRERVAVERVVITGRVIDRFANPVAGPMIAHAPRHEPRSRGT